MLKEFILKNHFLFVEEKLDWKSAIRKSCETLIRDNSVNEQYPEEIIKVVEEFGPYIVISPGIAIPHGKENSKFVNNTAISFTKFLNPVIFDKDDADRNASLFFTIASKDKDIHLKNISNLMNLLTNKQLVEQLNKCSSKDELIRISEKFKL